mmetsp:Transcript_25112/g.38626  ORF Transcript_25112/g.38626 Transcript_25112/m.38626 type:complete len:274 (-) Transcript_25112:36-857(-)
MVRRLFVSLPIYLMVLVLMVRSAGADDYKIPEELKSVKAGVDTNCTNDDPCDAIELLIDGPKEVMSTIGCSVAPNVEFGGEVDNSAWAYFVAPATGCIDISFVYDFGMTFLWYEDDNVEMGLYLARKGCESKYLKLTEYNDDYDGSLDPRIIVTDGSLIPGATYYVMLDGVSGDGVSGFMALTDPCVTQVPKVATANPTSTDAPSATPTISLGPTQSPGPTASAGPTSVPTTSPTSPPRTPTPSPSCYGILDCFLDRVTCLARAILGGGCNGL